MSIDGYTYLCRFDALEEGVPRRFEAEGVPVSLVLTREELFAIYDVCSHSAVSLSEGEVEGCTVECWLHGSRFDLRTGKPLDPPASRPVLVYPVRIEGGRVYVDVVSRSDG
ncbi:non-heme iron oxygenase ferredoxin subunit [Streptomyces justiciae]|uniref:non-heme iron oxygenase ferredoxin subunit n=1 Tax=Streptomyces justiciae TaxID=2780140 RepID=UPI00187E6D3E|nr:non-heme iron oxygenase ferredoxin subunit [Streptomyces justiciae]MBE8475735.1 non-heme iron oxygenase ferredoxin subunit [Streptomyces justiciae]MCW8382731.1 non-heme iron oxygenase ferredoxin subunit [Streptomyces justiciae]